ncbi:MAG: UrcA family protein [Sphingomonas phyllosphaerae]|uniref:UrcA family protein n=1 Tax=Sphingomonas phyllosphaerae TaxID=257003 RepID=UPI002FFBAC8E
MNRFDFAALAASLTLALLPSVAAADANRVALTARVAVHDLDLTTDAGQRQFRRRVDYAAAMICGSGMNLRDRLDVLRCHSEMRKDAQVRLAALTRTRGVELAAVTAR